jgi:exodeoxyribonuclease VII large subunit
VRAVIWRSQYAMLAPYFEAQTGSRLGAGMKIMAKVVVSYHELYGLSLQITDINPSYTLGEVERQKQQTIAQLQSDGVWDMNRSLALPRPLQRIAVISSEAAAGYRDFCNELRGGGYAIFTTLFDAVVQGAAAEESICGQLESIANRAAEFDVVVIIRGGGSVNDLSCFNSYRLCSYVAQFPLPVLTGIGHDKDTSVADMVAHTPLKTPTAVAGWLTERMARHDAWLDESLTRLHDMAIAASTRERLRIERLYGELSQYAVGVCEQGKAMLVLKQEQLQALIDRVVEREKVRLQGFEAVVEARHPQNILRMGFALIRSAGKVVGSTDGLSAGAMVDIEMSDGKLSAEVKSVEKR